MTIPTLNLRKNSSTLQRRQSLVEKEATNEIQLSKNLTNRTVSIKSPVKTDRPISRVSSVDSHFPYMSQPGGGGGMKILTVKEMREMPISEKFYHDASRMVYDTTASSFMPKGTNTYLAKMKREQERELMSRQNTQTPSEYLL